MKKEKLLRLLKQEPNEIDAIGMILSNYIDFGGTDGGMVSVKQFNKVAECLLEWWKDKTPSIMLALLSGGDWADASVCHLVKVSDKSVNELNEEYQNEGSYRGTQKWFREWLIQKGYCREADEKDIEIFDETI
jgi:hypothetical protein